MSNGKPEQKKKAQFNIISGDPTGGDGSYGVGALHLDNVTPVIVDPEEGKAYIDMDAMHARSKVEKRVRFSPNKDELKDARLYWIVWVVTERGKNGPQYTGIGACEIRVSREERRIRPGYKSMPEHVNHLDKALKHHVIVDKMDAESKALLKGFLKNERPEIWENTSETVKAELESKD
ncbi:MAG TPA: YwhD family protein [Bacillales bacterium]|nr:YwhD family protein [Bacillales bacterium]